MFLLFLSKMHIIAYISIKFYLDVQRIMIEGNY